LSDQHGLYMYSAICGEFYSDGSAKAVDGYSAIPPKIPTSGDDPQAIPALIVKNTEWLSQYFNLRAIS